MNLEHELLVENVTIQKATELQEKYRKFLDNENPAHLERIENLKIVAGVDVAYYKSHNKEYGLSCAVLWDIEKKKMIEWTHTRDSIRFSYHPGFLGFRECRIIAQSIIKLSKLPDVLICDGHGIIHPKRFGEAVQLGVALNIPSLGVAKNPFVGHLAQPSLERKKGNKTEIWQKDPNIFTIENNSLLGYWVCLNDSKKPIFVSPGYKLTLNIALEIALNSTLSHRQPEPVYLADKHSKNAVKEITIR
jgi:deoxyribonuclease V